MPVKQNSTLCYLLVEDQVKCIAKANDVISNFKVTDCNI